MIGTVAWWITVIGALNIGIVNLFGKDFLASLLGGNVMKTVYIVVGLAAVCLLLQKYGILKK